MVMRLPNRVQWIPRSDTQLEFTGINQRRQLTEATWVMGHIVVHCAARPVRQLLRNDIVADCHKTASLTEHMRVGEHPGGVEDCIKTPDTSGV